MTQREYKIILKEILKYLSLESFFTKKITKSLEIFSLKPSKDCETKMDGFLDLCNCKLCYNILNNPYQCGECEQYFCKKCLISENNKSEFIEICPNESCRNHLTPNIKKNPILLGLLNEVQINCPLGTSCEKKLKLDQLEKHISECESIPADSIIYECQFCLNKLTNLNMTNEDYRIMLYEHLKSYCFSNFNLECKKCLKSLDKNKLIYHFTNECFISDINEIQNNFHDNSFSGYAELNGELKKLKDEVEKLNNQNRNIEREKESLSKTNLKLTYDFENQKETNNKLSEVLNSLKIELERFKETNNKLTEESNSLKIELERFKETNKKYIRGIRVLRIKNKNLAHDLKTSTEIIRKKRRYNMFSVEKVYEFLDRIKITEDDNTVEKDYPKTTYLTNGKKIVNISGQNKREKLYIVYQLAINKIYCGQMERNKFNGKGTFYSAAGDKYEGEFSENYFEGYGEYKWNNENQDFYQGEWKQDKRHGLGYFYSDNKPFYIGEFKNDLFDGIGINFNTNEKFNYQGEFEKGFCKGTGIKAYYSEENGAIQNEKFEGIWDKFELNGKGDYYINDKLVYSGEFKEGQFEGIGKKSYKNGSAYLGQFKNGFENGQGRLIVYIDDFEIKEETCEWKNGRKVGAADDWVNSADLIMIRISRNKLSKKFNCPISISEHTDYYNLITHPMDFGTIKNKLRGENGFDVYRSFNELKNDFELVIRNINDYFGINGCFKKNVESLKRQFNNLTEEFGLN